MAPTDVGGYEVPKGDALPSRRDGDKGRAGTQTQRRRRGQEGQPTPRRQPCDVHHCLRLAAFGFHCSRSVKSEDHLLFFFTTALNDVMLSM